jgi:tetratricopeptide (TPR) repeat protein
MAYWSIMRSVRNRTGTGGLRPFSNHRERTSLASACRCWLPVVLAGVGMLVSAQGTTAESRPPSPPLPEPLSRLEGIQLQFGDEPLRTLSPKTPVTDAEGKRREALAHFMTGRLQQERRQLNQALQSYLKAVEADPESIEPYQAAIPILLQQRNFARARELSLSAARHSEDGFSLVQTMAAIFARQEQLDQAIELIGEALRVPGLKPGSVQNLILHRDLGLYHRLNDDFEKAAAEYKLVLDAVTEELDEAETEQVLSDPGKNLDEFGDTFLKAKLPELALRAFEEASKYREGAAGLHSFNLATVFQQTGKPERALEELEGYFKAQLQTRGRAAYQLLKDLLEELERSAELIPRLREIYASDKHNEVLRFFLADELLASEEIDEAEQLYTNGREKVTDPRALVGMLAIQRKRDDPKKLFEILTTTFKTVPRPEDDAVLQQMAPDVKDLAQRFDAELDALKEDEEAIKSLFKYARSLQEGDDPKLEFGDAYIMGKLATEGDFTDDALNFYRFAISMRNDPPAMLYSELGLHLLDAQRYEDAIDVLSEAADHPSNDLQRERWRFLFFLSYAYEFQGETEQALQAIREAQSLNPNFSRLLYQEAWVYYHARQWDEALRLFERVLREHSDDDSLVRDVRFRMSNIYVEQGDMAKGEKILEEVLEQSPDHPQANNDLGYLWADQGKNLERAHEMIQLALEAEPDNPAYLDSMGWVLYKLERYEEALPYLQRATEQKHGEDGTIYDHLGDCLKKLGRQEEAIAAWEKALELEEEKKHPSQKLLDSLREKLKSSEEKQD